MEKHYTIIVTTLLELNKQKESNLVVIIVHKYIASALAIVQFIRQFLYPVVHKAKVDAVDINFYCAFHQAH